MQTSTTPTPAQTDDQHWRDKARETYALSDDISIDEDATISHAENGCWVAAWVWVPDEEAEQHLGCDLCDRCCSSDRIISHTDHEGKTVCTKCAAEDDEDEQYLGTDLCDACGESNRIASYTDDEGKTVCTKCAAEDEEDEAQAA
jgi:formylmethanofuran dehydrogenase subunit E